MSNVIHLTTQVFPQALQESRPLLLDFWAPWCMPCRMQGPILEEVSQQMGERALIAKVNVDEEPALAARYAVQSIPTLVVMKGGQVLKRMVGVQGPDTLLAALEGALP